MDAPVVILGGLRIFASRDGDRVSGQVDFPYAMHGRSTVPIDYHSRRPDAPPNSALSIPHSALDSKASARLKLVAAWRSACAEDPGVPKAQHARLIVRTAPFPCSLRSLQLWASKLDTIGPEGLIDGFIPRPRKVLSLTGDLASDAIKICTWWSFRIGNNPLIDSTMMHSAVSLLSPSPHRGEGRGEGHSSVPVADVLATIDCYYAWVADRTRFPFKPFSRWARYDFEKWLLRAANENDYRRTIAEQRGDKMAVDPIPGVAHPVPLLDPPRLSPSQGKTQRGSLSSLRACPASKTRRRDVLDRSTRQSLRALSEWGAEATRCSPCDSSAPGGPPFVASSLRGFMAPSSSIASALVSLDDSYRVMLLRAAQGDTDARRQAASTFPVWWGTIPAEVRGPIEAATHVPLSQRRPGDEDRITLARVRLFLPLLRRGKAGFHKLGVAAGLI